MNNKQALDALDKLHAFGLSYARENGKNPDRLSEYYSAIRAALTQPVNKMMLEALKEMADDYGRFIDGECAGLYNKAIAAISAASSAPVVEVVENLEDALDSCIRYPKCNDLGFMCEADREIVLQAARLQLERQKSAAEKAGV